MNLGIESTTEASRITVCERFENLAERFCSFAEGHGYTIVPTHNNYKKFRSLPHEVQKLILHTFEIYYGVLISVHSQGRDLADSRSTTWAAIRELGLVPPSDLFEYLEENDIFEIYSPEHIQIFRSLNFFPLTSYSLEDVFSYSWDELYSRSEVITKDMYELGTKVMKGEIRGVTKGNFPRHAVIAKFSPGKETTLIQHKLFAPLRSTDHEIFAFNAFNVVDGKEPK